MIQEVNVFDYNREIMEALKRGVLLSSKADGKGNVMTISWGTLGIEWARPIFTVFVRENRYTKELLDKNPEFTISIPYGDFDKKILGVCGTQTGRETDKIEKLKLTCIEPQEISVPAIKELPLTLECKVIYKQEQSAAAILGTIKEKFYPEDVDSSFHGANRDFHTAYYGEIVKAYIIK